MQIREEAFVDCCSGILLQLWVSRRLQWLLTAKKYSTTSQLVNKQSVTLKMHIQYHFHPHCRNGIT